MAITTKLFGYWICSIDKKSAEEAVKMAGLPVLLMGFNAALTSLVVLLQATPNPIMVALFATIAFLLIVIAFRIRSGKTAWMPLVLVLFAAFLSASALTHYFLWKSGEVGRVNGLQIVTSWIVPLICTILVVSGFKGWRWLRINSIRGSF